MPTAQAQNYAKIDAALTAELGAHWARDEYGHFLLGRFCDEPGDGIDWRAELSEYLSHHYGMRDD